MAANDPVSIGRLLNIINRCMGCRWHAVCVGIASLCSVCGDDLPCPPQGKLSVAANVAILHSIAGWGVNGDVGFGLH